MHIKIVECSYKGFTCNFTSTRSGTLTVALELAPLVSFIKQFKFVV